MAETCGIKRCGKTTEAVNCVVLLALFILYALTFTVARVYDVTYPYAGVINFCMLTVLLFNNVNVGEAVKTKDREFIILALLILITGVNLVIVDSGKGAFFVAVNFMLIWYLSDKMCIGKDKLKIFALLYAAYLVFYLFIAYPRLFTTFENYKYNTNTAATFTVYTMLVSFIFLEMIYERSEVTGLIMVAVLLKGFQLALWHRARGAFVMLTVFMILRYAIPKKLWSRRWFYVTLCIMATLGSLLFVGLYIMAGRTGANFRMPFFYKEVFSGREQIWYELFCKLVNRDKPYMLFTGIGTNFTLESFFEKNVHNAMYNYVVIHGLIVFAGILYFIYARLGKMRSKIMAGRVSMSAMCTLMAVFFESYFDVDLIWADYALNLIFLLCILSRFDADDDLVSMGSTDG